MSETKTEFDVMFKFNEAMVPTKPLLNFNAVVQIAKALGCVSPEDTLQKINACYKDVEVTDESGNKVPSRMVNDVDTFSTIATEIIYATTKAAYEVNGKAVDYNHAQIKNKLDLELCSKVMLWFISDGVMQLYVTKSDPNNFGTIHII